MIVTEWARIINAKSKQPQACLVSRAGLRACCLIRPPWLHVAAGTEACTHGTITGLQIKQEIAMKLTDAQQLVGDAKPRTDAAWLEAHWMPFSGNRNFKAKPRMIVGAKGCYY